jgi:hypothetical protein
VKPVIHVDPYIRLDPLSPFSERFKVSNDGYLPIYNVDSTCSVTRTQTTNHVYFDDDMIKDEGGGYRNIFEAASSMTVDCPFQQVVYMGDQKFLSAEIEFSIDFNPYWHFGRKHKLVKFSGQLDSHGDVQWTY